MAKIKNIAEVCHLLMESKHGISVNSLRCRLDLVHERTVYRYIKDINDMVGVFGYELEERKKHGRRVYRILKKN
jgi:transcriptional antiterminator